MDGQVYYQSVQRGLQNPAGSDPITYFGVTYRIPRSEHATLRQVEWEPNPRELMDDVALADGRNAAPVDDAIVERFETYDRDTGDVLVMYRVPCRVGGNDGAS